MLAANMMNADFRRLSPSQTALDALDLCRAERAALLPVVGEGDRLIGVVSAYALVKEVLSNGRSPDAPEFMRNIDGLAVKKVGDIIEKGFLSVLPDAPAAQVAALFLDAAPGVETIFVLDNGARLLGVITLWDFFKRLSAYAEKA